MSDPAAVPLVSIIVPCYNSARFLSQTMQSIVNQSYRPLEIVAVNDGSNDSTESILNSWIARCGAEHVALTIVRQENAGVAAAMNSGLDHASGTYLGILGHDDLLPSNRTVELVDAMRRSGAELALGQVVRFRENSEISTFVDNPAAGEIEDEVCPPYWKFWPSIQGCLFARTLVDRVGRFLHGITPGEDVEFVVRCRILANRLVKIASPVVYYRVLDRSLSHRRMDQAYVHGNLTAMQSLIDIMDKQRCWSNLDNLLARNSFRRLLAQAALVRCPVLFQQVLSTALLLGLPERSGRFWWLMRGLDGICAVIRPRATMWMLRLILTWRDRRRVGTGPMQPDASVSP